MSTTDPIIDSKDSSEINFLQEDDLQVIFQLFKTLSDEELRALANTINQRIEVQNKVEKMIYRQIGTEFHTIDNWLNKAVGMHTGDLNVQ